VHEDSQYLHKKMNQLNKIFNLDFPGRCLTETGEQMASYSKLTNGE